MQPVLAPDSLWRCCQGAVPGGWGLPQRSPLGVGGSMWPVELNPCRGLGCPPRFRAGTVTRKEGPAREGHAGPSSRAGGLPRLLGGLGEAGSPSWNLGEEGWPHHCPAGLTS